MDRSLAMYGLPLFDADAAMGDVGSLPAVWCGELAPPASAGVSKKQLSWVSNETGDAGNRQMSREQHATLNLADAVKRKAPRLISGDLRAPAARHRGPAVYSSSVCQGSSGGGRST